jgi:hypothetical protein
MPIPGDEVLDALLRQPAYLLGWPTKAGQLYQFIAAQ